ncbi:MAG: hypothetical protein SVK54_03985 [candidate division WOR-3 bacterium]|nr:hypothetical protein [candidate division WOR-3 bacterium]
MKRVIFLIVISIILFSFPGCTDTKTQEDINALNKRIDQLSKKIEVMETKLNRVHDRVYPEMNRTTEAEDKLDKESLKTESDYNEMKPNKNTGGN